MKKSITGLLLACYFLAGSIIFPLSDFSLMRDLPGMYRSYCEIRAGEPDICDFVGDYLLHGKELLGITPMMLNLNQPAHYNSNIHPHYRFSFFSTPFSCLTIMASI